MANTQLLNPGNDANAAAAAAADDDDDEPMRRCNAMGHRETLLSTSEILRSKIRRGSFPWTVR